jgi:single-stranded-DNA-specific exonuclease
MVWEKKAVDSSRVRQISSDYGIDLLTASVLERRGIREQEQIKFYLESDLAYLHNPFLFEDMETAVDRILEAAAEGEKVRIFGDRDVDGMTSTVILVEGLREVGIEADWKLPEGDEPYGLTKEGVRAFYEDHGTLIITVDCGISNHAEIACAAELGIDTIVLDHHLSDTLLPPAAAVINPKIEGCGYPFADLAGCGVAAKLIWALRFSSTDLYKQEMVLLHAEPGSGTVIIEAVKLENLIEIDRLRVEVVPGVLNLTTSRLADFLIGLPILTYNRDIEYRQLREAFGSRVDIHLIETSAEIIAQFPALSGKSLTRLRQMSRAAKYQSGGAGEIDIFLSLFNAYIRAKYPQLSTGYAAVLDLVAIGTVADLMPMRDENRILVRSGMKQLNSNTRPALAAYLAEQNLLGRRLSTTDIGWQVSPAFNAAGRLGVPQVAVHMLLSTEAEEQSRLARELISLNRERKRIGDEAWERLFLKAGKSLSEHNHKLIVVNDRKLHRGITGIIATRLMNHYRAPAMVIAHLEEKMIGSVRSLRGLNVKDFLSGFEDLLIDYGGHPQAGGFSVKPHNFDLFLKRVYNASEHLDEMAGETPLSIDAEVPVSCMNPELIKVVELFEPYGEDNRPLQFLLRSAVLQEAVLMGSGEVRHLRLLLKSGSLSWPAVFWRSGDRLNRDFSPGDSVDVVFRLGRNYYKNSETLQLTVLDIARTGSKELTNGE